MSYAPRNILNIDYLAQTNSTIEVVEGSLPTAGDGLTVSGTSFSVNADGTSLEVVSDVLRVKADGIGTTHIKRWQDFNFLSTTDSDATSTGAITTLGGVGVAKNLNVGGTVKIDDVTNSTSASTGSFRTLGGIGVTKDIHAGGQIHALSTAPSAGTTSGSIIASGGIGCAGDIHVGGVVHQATAPTNPTHLATKAYVDGVASSITAGETPAVVAGAGIDLTGTTVSAKVSNVGIEIDGSNQIALKDGGISSAKMGSGQFSLTNTTDSDASSTGALTLAGGLGVVKRVFSGQSFNIRTGATENYSFRQVNGNLGTGVSISNESNTVTTSRLNIGSTIPVDAYTSQLMIYSKGFNTFSTQQRLVLESNDTKASIYFLATGSGTSVKPLEIYGSTTFATNGDVTASGVLSVTNATASTSTSTGALKVTGGLGVGGALHAGSLNTTGEVILTGGQVRLKLNGTRSIWLASASGDGAGDFHIWDNTSSRRVLGYYVTANQFVIGSSAGTIATILSGTQPSTSKTSGALQVAGGAGISGDLWATNVTATGTLAGTLTTPAQPNVTSVGTLTSLTVSGDISGTLVTASQPNITSFGTLSSLAVTGTGSFGGTVSVGTPTLDAHATTKAYVDAQVSAGVLAGTGLTKTGSTLSVNASQTQITSIGTLSSLAVTGEATVDGLVHTNGSTTYKFRPFNGIGFGMSLDNSSSGATQTRFNMVSSSATGEYTSTLNLYSLGWGGGSNQQRFCMEATPTEYRIYSGVGGSGAHKPILIGGSLGIATSGIVSIQNTLDTSGSATGSLQVAGGAYIAKKLYTDGDVTVNRASEGANYLNVLCKGQGFNANTDNASGVFLNSHAYTGTGITGSYLLSRKVSGNYRLEIRSHNDSTGNNELYQYTQNNGTYFAKNIFPNGSETIGTSTARWSGVFSTGFNARSNTSPQIQVQPVTDGNETSMLFYRKGDASSSSAGDVWCLGHNVDSVGAGNFAVYTHITGKVLEITSAGLVTAPKSIKVGTGGTATQCVWHGLVNAGNSGAPNDLKGVACTYGITLPNVDYRIVCSAELTGNRNGSFAVSITNKTTTGCTLMLRRTDPDGAGDGYWSGGKGWNFEVWISVVVYQP